MEFFICVNYDKVKTQDKNMKRILNKETIKCIGKEVKVCGWVNTIRSHGKIIFIDLRDRSGILQLVCPVNLAKDIRPEWVISVEGIIKQRPKGMQNPKLKAGRVELKVENLEVLNKSKTSPFEVNTNTKDVNEELRLKYRYLDLRTERMKKNLIFRHKAIKYIRDFMDENEFIEIETPLLTKSTPEGARDFIIPSRLHPGKFYALPQSPQQYKQLLMVAGVEKYFQIAKCLRDEDLRADRQFEFTQLDIEMAFTSQDEILDLVEELCLGLIKKIFLNKKITQTPFPRFKYEQVMKKYGTDSPDIRKDKSNSNELGFCWIIDFPLFEKQIKQDFFYGAGEKIAPSHHMFTAPKEEDIKLLDKEPLKVKSLQYDLVLNGVEIAGGSIRIHESKIQEKIFELIGFTQEQKQEFSHLLSAFEYGCPPHGGIAFGFDRFLAAILDEPSIREVIAFPKMGDGQDPMMNTPAEISKEQLKELHIQIFQRKTQKGGGDEVSSPIKLKK